MYSIVEYAQGFFYWNKTMVAKRIYENLPKELYECAWCHFALPLSEFSIDSRRENGLRVYCRQCRSERRIGEHLKRDIDKYNIARKKWRGAKTERDRNIDYGALLSSQDNKCAICQKSVLEYKKRFCIDHDHETGKTRGLLCHSCNLALGNFKDSVNSLKRAVKYLEYYI